MSSRFRLTRKSVNVMGLFVIKNSRYSEKLTCLQFSMDFLQPWTADEADVNPVSNLEDATKVRTSKFWKCPKRPAFCCSLVVAGMLRICLERTGKR